MLAHEARRGRDQAGVLTLLAVDLDERLDGVERQCDGPEADATECAGRKQPHGLVHTFNTREALARELVAEKVERDAERIAHDRGRQALPERQEALALHDLREAVERTSVDAAGAVVRVLHL